MPFHTAYRTVPRLSNTVPYRLALLIFSLYRLVPRRDGTVRYGIGTAYRQSLNGILISRYWNDEISRNKTNNIVSTAWTQETLKITVSSAGINGIME